MFYDRFMALCKDRGKSAAAVVRDIGLNNSAPTTWKRGSIPKGDTLQKLADYFEVSVDYLLGTEKGKAPVSEYERQKRIEQLTTEINEQKKLLQNITDNAYALLSALKNLVGLDRQIPSDILFKDSEREQIQKEIEGLVVKFIEAAEPEERAVFLLRLDQIVGKFHQQMDSVEPHNHDIYSQYLPPPPQSAPAPQEGKDTTPTPDALEMPPEGKK